MDLALLDELQQTFEAQGPQQAVERLCDKLRESGQYNALFYALLMKKRHELGVSPVATGRNQDLPAGMHAEFEETIRDAGRTVGNLFLAAGDIPAAWAYFRMLGEVEPVAQALEKKEMAADEDCHPVIDIAFNQQVSPRKGFDWILQRYGTCSAITSLGGGEVPLPQDAKNYCIQRLIRTLHAELTERLKTDIAKQQGFEPTGQSLADLVEGRDWLFADDCYHIDLSHLSSVVQMSMQIDSCAEWKLARDLCAYGKKLSPRFGYDSDPPFENQYRDYDVYLGILTGEDVEGGLAHFRAKAVAADPETIGTFPAEVLVNLLLRLGREQEALAAARQFLSHVQEGGLSCPGVVELCQKTGDYAALEEVARQQGNAIHFLAGLLGQRSRSASRAN